jgi:sulfatase modifying factor 1
VFLDAFCIDKYEVTNRQYARFLQETGHRKPAFWEDERFNRPEQPVVGVAWEDAVAYAQWAGKRLPTEAEWEKAARGTDGREYPWGNTLTYSLECNSAGTQDNHMYTAPVGSFPADASPYGVMDMAGNAWEWCADWYDPIYYHRTARRNPRGPDAGELRVRRGFSWDDGLAKTTGRQGKNPLQMDSKTGFRCARDMSVR